MLFFWFFYRVHSLELPWVSGKTLCLDSIDRSEYSGSQGGDVKVEICDSSQSLMRLKGDWIMRALSWMLNSSADNLTVICAFVTWALLRCESPEEWPGREDLPPFYILSVSWLPKGEQLSLTPNPSFVLFYIGDYTLLKFKDWLGAHKTSLLNWCCVLCLNSKKNDWESSLVQSLEVVRKWPSLGKEEHPNQIPNLPVSWT